MLDRKVVQDVLGAALASGADLAEIFVENTMRETVNMVNGVVEKANWGIDYGLGLRVIFGTSCIYAFTNNTSPESLLALAKESAEAARFGIAEGTRTLSVITLDRRDAQKFADNVAISPESVGKKTIVEMLRRASKASFDYDALVSQTTGGYLHVAQDVLVANSNGVWAEDSRVRTRAMFTAVASEGSEKQTGQFFPGAKGGFEVVQALNVEDIGRDVARCAVTMLKADLCPSGRMPVVVDNGFGGVIFHEACAHSLEATSVAKGASVFCNKLGEKIAHECVNAVDDATLPGEWGSINIDDEGAATRRNVLIENGVLKSYLVDYLNGLKMNMPSTGSGRRESYRFAPTSRMSNTYILPGTLTPEQIISQTEHGLYAKQMGGGSVDPASGQFNFAVLEGYLIKDGKIDAPVRGATLIGKGHEVLMGIDLVGNNFAASQGMCGSMSGSIPTNVGQPMVRVAELTVGGRK